MKSEAKTTVLFKEVNVQHFRKLSWHQLFEINLKKQVKQVVIPKAEQPNLDCDVGADDEQLQKRKGIAMTVQF